MKGKKLSISIIVVLFLLFAAVSTLVYNQADGVAIRCHEGSYAHTYAQDNNLDFELISDSDDFSAELNLEDFDYNENGTITGYRGKSEKVALPTEIDGITMTRVAEYTFEYAENVRKIYIPKTITTFNARHLKDVTVYMYKNTALYQDFLKDDSIKFEIKLIPDSYDINYQNAEIPFAYNNISDQSIDITQYTGTESVVIIPESINGKIVTTISLDALAQGIDTLVIPGTVTSIQTPLFTNRYDSAFLIGMLIAFVSAMVAVAFVLTLKVEDKVKAFLTVSQFRTAYLVAVFSLILAAVYLFVPAVPDVVVFVLLALVYGLGIVSVLKAKVAVDTVEKVEQKVKQQTFFIKSLTVDAETVMETAKAGEMKAIAKKVYEAIRYSDPMTNAMLVEVEEKIQSSFIDFENAVAAEDSELTASTADVLLSLISVRNKKCKLLK